MYSIYISDLRNLDEWMDGWINGIRRTNPMNFHFHFHFPFRRFREFPNIHHRSIINQSINQKGDITGCSTWIEYFINSHDIKEIRNYCKPYVSSHTYIYIYIYTCNWFDTISKKKKKLSSIYLVKICHQRKLRSMSKIDW